MCALAAVQAGLSAFRGLKGRLQRRAAMHWRRAARRHLQRQPRLRTRRYRRARGNDRARSVLVLGDMGEIGEMSAQFHDEIGGYAKSQGIDRLFALGEASALAAHNFR
jgi:UDP-N-acetylmuramoyl-tripeptide--D-alanyl-D-alanine ligase